MTTRKYFGTDGIRGRAGVPPMVPQLLVKLGWAMGTVLAQNGTCRILIGKDTRVTGYMFESALEAGLAAAGVDTYLLGPMPTPAIAYLTRSMEFDAGIVISASHNPYYDNGVKIFSHQGMKIDDAKEMQIETLVDEVLVMVAPEKIGRAYRVEDGIKRYVEFCKNVFPANLSLAGVKMVVDCANGANYYIAPRVLTDLGAQVTTIANSPNGLNINEDCGSTHPERLQQTVVQTGADLGIAFDGDGDRVLMVDHRGEIVDGDEMLFIIARAAHLAGETVPGVVGTVMTNLGLEQALNKMQMPLVRTPVGDRYVLEALQKQNWLIGGEPSGHIIHLGHSTTGDGIVAALLVLAALVKSGEPLFALKQHMQKCPQKLINVQVDKRQDPMAIAEIRTAVDQANQQLHQRGRVLLRASGTEPVIRVMVEGVDVAEIDAMANHLAQIVESECKG